MNRRALRFPECFSSVPILLPEQSEVFSGEIPLSSPVLLPSPCISWPPNMTSCGAKAFFDCFCSEVWVGSCFLLGLDSPTTIISLLEETVPLLSLLDVLQFLFVED